MNLINNQPYEYYGLIPSKIDGILDMPSRLGDIFYDWGDYYEPLVDQDDIFWMDQNIKIDVFFDGNRFGMNLDECLNLLKSLPNRFELTTNYGSCDVQLKQVIKTKEYTDCYARLKLIFTGSMPNVYKTSMGVPIGGNGTAIDGFDLLNYFGMVVQETKLDEIPVLKPSNITVFNASKPFTKNRTIRTIRLSCIKVYDNLLELRETTEKFKQLLSKNGLRTLFYKDYWYACFLSEGFSVRFFGKNAIKFNLKLNIIETNFVELGFIEPSFIARTLM